MRNVSVCNFCNFNILLKSDIYTYLILFYIYLFYFAVFIDVFTVAANMDFINLATFDFQTPLRDPKVADHPASLYELYERDPTNNIDYQVRYWLLKTAPANILNIGIAGYGRAWQMTADSGITGYPPIPSANGTAPAGRYTVTPGLLSWPEICEKLVQSTNKPDAVGAEAPLHKVGDPTHRYGIYAYRSADDNGEHGIWVGYDDPTTAAIKAGYVNAKGLGGVAFFDLSMDDFRGQCAGEKFPILRSIKYKL